MKRSWVFILLFLWGLPVFSEVKEYRLTCDADSFQYIHDHYRNDIWISASLEYAGRTWPRVKLRIRGDSSRRFPKKSLKVRCEESLFAHGRDTYNFNADYLDKSYMNSMLSSRMMKASGQACFSAEPARLYLNGAFLGLYISIENMDDYFLEANGLRVEGNLYKATRDGACLSVFDDVWRHWEKKTNENRDRSDLETLIRQVNETADADFYNMLNREFDYDALINIIAMNMLTANGSTYYHNYYMYHDEVWRMLPWDMDRTFHKYGWNLSYQKSSNTWSADNPLLERSLLSPRVFEDIRHRIDTLHQTLFRPDYLEAIMDSLETELMTSVLEDTTDDVAGLDEWRTFIQWNRRFVQERYGRLQEQFDHWPRSFRVLRASDVFTQQMAFYWRPSVDPDGDEVTYTVKFSPQGTYPDSSTVYFRNIQDTSLLVPELPPEGVYYWNVTASDGQHVVEGFDNWNIMTVKSGGVLPQTVSQDLILRAEDSPFTASGEVLVESGACLTVEAGCEIRMPTEARIVVQGTVDIQGSRENPVRFIPNVWNAHWGGFLFQYSPGHSRLSHVTVEGVDADSSLAVIARQSSVHFDHVAIEPGSGGIAVEGGSAEFRYCQAAPMVIQEAAVRIEKCRFSDAAQGVFIIRSDSIQIHDSIFSRISGCGIEAEECRFLSVTGNRISFCAVAGVRLTGSNGVEMSRNLIQKCQTGVALADGASVSIHHHTFFDNDLALGGSGQNQIDVTGTLFSRSGRTADSHLLADMSVNYCLADDLALPGNGNLRADPRLVMPDSGRFHLLADFPCIDAGSPDSPLDADGTRADIGAFSYNSAFEDLVVINEINYHSLDASDPGEWVEIFNPQDRPVNLSGWQLKDGRDDHVFVVPEETWIDAGAFRVFCNNRFAFDRLFMSIDSLSGDFTFGLKNSGEPIRLYNASLNLVDSVAYSDQGDWPQAADGEGYTLELINPRKSNSDPANWGASSVLLGTPGAPNSLLNDSTDSTPVQEMALYQNFPNPFNEMTTFRFDACQKGTVEVEIFNVRGQRIFHLRREYDIGRHDLIWDASDAASGVYLCRFHFQGEARATIKALVVR